MDKAWASRGEHNCIKGNTAIRQDIKLADAFRNINECLSKTSSFVASLLDISHAR